MAKLTWTPIWFDSLGAKSTCTFVETPDVKVLIDPGAAVMQPSFPASDAKKIYWWLQAERAIKLASKHADIIIISHYHYDHFTDFDPALYKNKLILAKNPNEYINDSQFSRARNFINNFCSAFGEVELEQVLKPGKKREYKDPLEDLKLVARKKFGDYSKRRKELLNKGKKWFLGRVKKWNASEEVPELKFGKTELRFPERKSFRFGKTTLRFTKPLFHGIEYARVGWVFATVVEYGNEKFIHSSDLSGPIIEDQASWIVKERPNWLILDGPTTYLIPYMLNLINLRRAIDNILRIVHETNALIILDHHLLREKRYKKRLEKVYELAAKERKKVLSCAEYQGKVPKVLEV